MWYIPLAIIGFLEQSMGPYQLTTPAYQTRYAALMKGVKECFEDPLYTQRCTIHRSRPEEPDLKGRCLLHDRFLIAEADLGGYFFANPESMKIIRVAYKDLEREVGDFTVISFEPAKTA